jgi:HEAT repeat protein
MSIRASSAERALLFLKADIRPALPDLIRIFRSRSESFGAYRAANVLAGLGKQAFPKVMETISDPHFSNYFAGATLLGRMQDLGETGAAAVPFLCHHLKDGGGTLTMVCVGALGNLAAAPDEAVPVLVEALTNAMERSDVMLSRKCAEALARFGKRGGEAVGALCAALKSPDGIASAEAARALGKIGAHGEIAVPALIEYLSASPLHRKYAIEGLLGYGAAVGDAIPLLRDALQDEDHDTRAVAQEALDRLKQAGAYPAAH